MAFRNVLLAPLAKVKTEFWPASLMNPLAANASCHVTRHDHHNIEVKIVSELGDAPSSVETDLFLFIPRSFEIGTAGKSELMKDFRHRVRLAVPVSGEQGAAAFENALKSLRASMSQLEAAERSGEPVFNLNHALCEEVLEGAKDLCAVMAEALKQGAVEHLRQFFLSHTLLTTPDACVAGLEGLARNLRDTHEMITRVRAVTASNVNVTQAILLHFDEYLSQLYVLYLASIRSELEKLPAPKGHYNPETYDHLRERLERVLDRHQEDEAKHRVKFGVGTLEGETELERERRLVRLSHLKKFFQSKTFVDITKERSAQKIGESTAAIGTALAAIFVALIDRYFATRVGHIALESYFVLFLGVTLYVLRDRMKDWLKVRFQEKALQFLPDFEHQLIAKEKKIGRVREWFRLTKSSLIPTSVLVYRKTASATEMERRLPEDILHVRKVQDVFTTSLASAGHTTLSRALHENTRINFERYLKYMDDSIKDFLDLDHTGKIRQSRSHRVYHFYLCVRTVSRPVVLGWKAKLRALRGYQVPGKEQMQLYRIVLDKNGLVRLENATPAEEA